ncbi:non-homologous end joining protein Ku [Geotalea uraniireducens]|uniref:Non-homologous end joining protein Ku n=1 Tax=Geotalea uraniireducens TaxID=351604 RepID=A0ABM8EK80_9BACT|nr:Ku protein [Geotalea uraniireducens]BDV42948.1 non-homologous end joining protein Ku [Geotalea uraniireducens]
MAPQGIWSGTVSFSLVAIPVQLVRAVSPGRISFRLLHDADYAPLARQMFCPEREEAAVPAEEIARGYEIAPDRYIPLTDEELASVTPERSRTIEIVEFIDLAELDPLYFDHPYYLVPLKGGEKSYRLLAEVLQRTNRAGLAKFVLVEREYLVAVTGHGGALTVTTLHYPGEILPAAGSAPREAVSDAKLQERMQEAIARLTTDFAPGKYADERREKLLALLRRKAAEQAPVTAPVSGEEEAEGPPDLVTALEEAMRDMKRVR